MARDLFDEAGVAPDAPAPDPGQPAAAGGPRDLFAEAGVSPDQMTGALRKPAIFGSGAAKGLTDFLGTMAGGAAASGAAEGGLADPMQYLPATSGTITGAAKSAGLTDRPNLLPQDRTERIVSAAGQGAGGALPYSLVGGVPGLLWGLGSGAAGGATGEVAADAFPNHPELARAGGNLAGGLGIFGALKGLKYISTPAIEAIERQFLPGAVDRQAADAVTKTMTSEGAAPADLATRLAAAQDRGTPLTIADVAGEDTQGLYGKVYRTPGPARQDIRTFQDERDAGAGERITGGVDNATTGGSWTNPDEIIANQKAAAAPAYQAAFAGGSTAPLEDQFTQHFADATGAVSDARKQLAQANQTATLAAAKQATAGDVYTSASATADARAAEKGVSDAQAAVDAAEDAKAGILERLRKAQEDGSANAPGAVWSPRIQQFLDDPIMKGGLQRGLEIQRLESLAEGKPLNASEYAITGADEAGNPVVGQVPNMRLLDAGKRGLDATINDNKNEITGQLNSYGRAVEQVRVAYLKELDGINPLYAPARAAWSGPAQSQAAIRAGEMSLNGTPTNAAMALSKLSPNDQTLFRQGASNAYTKQIADTSDGGNEAARVMASNTKRQRLLALAKDNDSYNGVMQQLADEKAMFDTKTRTMGGPATAGRLAEDNVGKSAPNVSLPLAAGAAAKGNFLEAGSTLLSPYLRQIFGHSASMSPQVNSAIVRLLHSQDPEVFSGLVARMNRQPTLPGPRVAVPAGLLGSLSTRSSQ